MRKGSRSQGGFCLFVFFCFVTTMMDKSLSAGFQPATDEEIKITEIFLENRKLASSYHCKLERCVCGGGWVAGLFLMCPEIITHLW